MLGVAYLCRDAKPAGKTQQAGAVHERR